MRIILTEAHVDNKSILRILTQSKQINTSDPKYSQYNQLATWASSNQQKIKNIDLTTIPISNKQLITTNKLPKRFTTLGHALLSLKNLMDQQGHYDSGNSVSQLIQKTTLELLEFLKDGKAPNKEPELYEGMDWTAEKAKRLANLDGEPASKVLTKFYDDYYKIEYAGLKSVTESDPRGITSKLNSLNKILVQEFNKLGYNPDVNPLAQFLKIVIQLQKENKANIFNRLTPGTYSAIHNSFVDNYITGNTLGNYNERHLLFCEDLYAQRGTEIVEYLRLFKNTLNAATDKKEQLNQDPWALAAKIFIRQALPEAADKATEQNTFTNKVKALLNVTNIIFPTNTKATLRTLPEVNELYTYIFGAAPDTKESKEKESLKAIVTGAKAKNIMLDMIYYIASSNSFKEAHQEYAGKVAQQLETLKYTKSRNNLEDCRQVLAPYIKELDMDDYLTLVKKLAAAYNASNKKANR